MHVNFEKWKFLQAAKGNFAQKWLFCKTYVLYNICLSLAEVLEKHVQSSS